MLIVLNKIILYASKNIKYKTIIHFIHYYYYTLYILVRGFVKENYLYKGGYFLQRTKFLYLTLQSMNIALIYQPKYFETVVIFITSNTPIQ